MKIVYIAFLLCLFACTCKGSIKYQGDGDTGLIKIADSVSFYPSIPMDTAVDFASWAITDPAMSNDWPGKAGQ